MEHTLPDDHPDMIRIIEAAHHDIAPKAAEGSKSLASALGAAFGKVPGSGEDLENIDFLVHVLSVNRAADAIDDQAFEQLLLRIRTMAGRAELTRLFTEELEAEHGYEDEE